VCKLKVVRWLAECRDLRLDVRSRCFDYRPAWRYCSTNELLHRWSVCVI